MPEYSTAPSWRCAVTLFSFHIRDRRCELKRRTEKPVNSTDSRFGYCCVSQAYKPSFLHSHFDTNPSPNLLRFHPLRQRRRSSQWNSSINSSSTVTLKNVTFLSRVMAMILRTVPAWWLDSPAFPNRTFTPLHTGHDPHLSSSDTIKSQVTNALSCYIFSRRIFCLRP
jgi:hypothetical protein